MKRWLHIVWLWVFTASALAHTPPSSLKTIADGVYGSTASATLSLTTISHSSSYLYLAGEANPGATLAITGSTSPSATTPMRQGSKRDTYNRLTGMESKPDDPAASRRKLAFTYDAQGRRIGRDISVWTNGSYQVVDSRKFVYDGWHLVGELNAANNAVIRSYAWAGDRLMALRQGSTIYIPVLDANGNVMALVNQANRVVDARYEYGPYGLLLKAAGPMALQNPIRYSSQYQDDATGLIYYGYRYLNPATQRWISRDPIGMEGGFNLYGFAGNDPINYVDIQGLFFKEYFRDFGQGLYDLMMGDQSGGRYDPNNYGALRAELLGGIDRDNNVLREVMGEGTAFAGDQLTDYLVGKAAAVPIGVLGELGGNLGSKLAGKILGKLTQGEEMLAEKMVCEAGKATKCLEKGAELAKQAGKHAAEGVGQISPKVGTLGGQVVDEAFVNRLRPILAKQRVTLRTDADEYINWMIKQGYVPKNTAAGFLPSPGGATLSEIYLRRGATRYDVFHELKHWGDFRRLKFEEYEKLGPSGRERSVYEYMKRQKWLTPEELKNAEFNATQQ